MMERLQKLLAKAGIASRRRAEEMISAGRVRVNGKAVTELGTQVDPELDKVLVDNQPVALESKAYFILNKPRGYISDRDDTSNLKTALDLVPDGRRLFAAGRLDLMSEGMLFLTNDGELANQLTHPRYEHEKEYLALVYGTPDDKSIARLEKGILYDGEWMRADVAERAGRNQDVGEAGRDETWLRIILHEGKKRQIRHMCAALGHAVKRLVRVRMGALRLGNLKVGEWRKLSVDEVAQLRKTKERTAKRTPRPFSSKNQDSTAEDRKLKHRTQPGGKAAPRRDGPPSGKNFAPRRDGPPRRDSAPRRDGPAGKSFAPLRERPPTLPGAPRREGAPRRDEGPRREPPPSRTSFSPGRGGSPRTGGAPRRDGPPSGKNFKTRRDGPPRRDGGSRREPPPAQTSFSPGRGGSPRTGGAPRREGPPSGKSFAPRRDVPPRDDRKRDDGDRGGRGGFKPQASKRKSPPPRAPNRNSPPRSRKPNDKRHGA